MDVSVVDEKWRVVVAVTRLLTIHVIFKRFFLTRVNRSRQTTVQVLYICIDAIGLLFIVCLLWLLPARVTKSIGRHSRGGVAINHCHFATTVAALSCIASNVCVLCCVLATLLFFVQIHHNVIMKSNDTIIVLLATSKSTHKMFYLWSVVSRIDASSFLGHNWTVSWSFF